MRDRRLFHPLLQTAVVGAIALLPAIIFGVPNSGYDFPHHFRFALPFYEGIRNWDLYPGWLAESNGGYGDPSFRFYPPGLYYLMAALRIATGDWYAAALATFTLLSALSGIGAYFWARSYFTPETARWAGFFYVFAPYHINQFYSSSYLAEYAGASALPFAFAFVERVCREGGKRNIAGLAASYALLICTHLPLAVIGSLSLFVYALACLEKEKFRDALGRLSLSVLIGLAASSFFWATMISELSWIVAEDPLYYRKNLLFAAFSNIDWNLWWVYKLVFATAALFLPALAFFWMKRGEENERSLKAAGILLLFAFLMSTVISLPLWSYLPKLRMVQYPWRWLIVTSAAGSILAAGAVSYWIRRLRETSPLRPLALIAAGSVLGSIAYTGAVLIKTANYLPHDEFYAEIQSIPGSASIDYWTPIWTKKPIKEMSQNILAADRTVAVKSWSPEKREFDVSAGPAVDLRVRTLYYPHWAAFAGEKPLPIRPSADGAILISLPQEAVSVKLEFIEPIVSRISAAASALGWALIALLALLHRRRVSSLNVEH